MEEYGEGFQIGDDKRLRHPHFDEYGEVDEEQEGIDYGDIEEEEDFYQDEDLGEDVDIEGRFFIEGKEYAGTGFTEKDQPVFDSERLLEIAKKYGIENKVTQVVPNDVRKVVETGRKYEYVQPPTKKSRPVLPPVTSETLKPVKTLGDVMPPPLPKKNYSPESKSDMPKPPKNYKGSLKFGDKVEYSTSSSGIEGIIYRLESDFVEILNVKNGDIEKYKYSEIEDREVELLPQKYSTNDMTVVKVKGKKYSLPQESIWEEENIPEDLLVGGYITVDSETEELHRGEIVGFAKDGFKISEGKKIIIVPYGSSIKKLKPEKSGVETLNYYYGLPVPQKLRGVVVRKLTKLFTDIIGTSSSSSKKIEGRKLSEREIEILNNIRPFWRGEVKKEGNKYNVVWEFEGKKYQKEFQTKQMADRFAVTTYYENKFRPWMYARYVDEIRKHIPREEISREVDIIIQKKTEAEGLRDLVARYGGNFLNLDGRDVKNLIRENRQGVKALDVEIANALERLGDVRAEEMKGYSLQRFLAGVIMKYYRQRPVDKEKIYRELEQNWVMSEFNTIVPSKEEHALFEKDNLQELTREYSKVIQEYQRVSNIDTSSPKISMTTAKSNDISKETEIFERDCYALSGEEGTIFDYLKLVLKPVVYLTSPLKNYTQFLQAKLKSRDYEVSALSAATVPYYFPELAMNFENITDEEWTNLMKSLSMMLWDEIEDVVKLYISLENPSAKAPKTRTTVTDYVNWSKYTVSIMEKCAESDTATKYVTDDKGDYVYEQKVIDGKKMIVPKLEEKSLGELIICYDKDMKVFTCHEKQDLIEELSRIKNPINPATNKPYPPEFINKMRERYQEKIRQKVPSRKPPLSPRPVQEESESEEPTEDLFGEEDPETMNQLKELLPKKKGEVAVIFFCNYWDSDCQDIDIEWDDLPSAHPDKTFIRVDSDSADEIVSEYNVEDVPVFVVLETQSKKKWKVKGMYNSISDLDL